MAKIMSLIYREWILMRKILLLGLAVAAGMLLMFSFLGYSFQNGAFIGNEKLSNMFAKTGGYFETYLIVFFLFPVAGSCAAAYESDVKANWMRYAMTTPADTKARALAHTLFLFIRILAAFGLAVIAGMLMTEAFGKPFTAGMAADFGLYCCITLIPICISELFWSKAKDVISYKKQGSRMACVFGGLGVVVGLLCARTTKSAGTNADPLTALAPVIDKYVAFRNAVQPFVIPVLIGLIVLIYVTVKRNLDSLKRA
ncbi:MAG: hypothetical protein K5705_07515 [Oscillospiraceae bacterium]|nr:hypothetical protein [Oscillospiraceae bacterium]